MAEQHEQGEQSGQHQHHGKCGCRDEKGEPLYATAPSAETHRALDYAEGHLAGTLETLKRLVQIPSVSLAGFDAKDMRLSAEATAEVLRGAGLENVQTIAFGDVHPYVYADWVHKKDAPTVLLYAHHDVQPPGRDEKWKSQPFTPKESGGRLYGRGTADDKAGIMAHAAAIAAFLKTAGELPVNVKVLIEGEEEIGSGHLGQFVHKHKQLLQADTMVLTDGANFDTGVPSITTSLRGLCAVDVEIEALSHPVHSGLWGGILPDPVVALAKVLATLTDQHGEIAVPGLLDDIRPLQGAERQALRALDFGALARSATGLYDGLPFSVPEDQLAERLWRWPSLSVNAIQSGSRKLVSNVIQDGAWARVSIRTVPDMRAEKVVKTLTAHLEKACPAGFRIKVTAEPSGDWWTIDDPSKPVYQIAARALAKGYGHSTKMIGCGASIPFVQPLAEELGGIPALIIGIEDPYTNAHSENESLHLGDFRKTILGQIHLLADLSRYRRV